jgi:hypothetical protein
MVCAATDDEETEKFFSRIRASVARWRRYIAPDDVKYGLGRLIFPAASLGKSRIQTSIDEKVQT